MKSTPAPGDRVWTYLHGKAQEVKVYAVDILIISQDAKGGPELRRIPADRLYEDEAAVLRVEKKRET